MEIKNKTLVVIAGPTAVGKTAVGIELARYFQTEIISADSRQFYREMTIGTAKPDAHELQEVRHHFINSHSIDDAYNAGRFEEDALKILQELFTRFDIVFLVGGSGMYIKALTEGLDDLPSGDPSIRSGLQDLKNEKGIEALQEMLKKADPVYFDEVDIANPQRLIRALEVIQLSGRPFSEWRKNQKKQRSFQVIKIGITQNKALLYERINSRIDTMVSKGLKLEAENLYAKRTINALQTVGYKEIFGFIDGLYDWNRTVELLKQNSRRYAKRQLTWFRQDPEYSWFEPGQVSDIIELIKARCISP